MKTGVTEKETVGLLTYVETLNRLGKSTKHERSTSPSHFLNPLLTSSCPSSVVFWVSLRRYSGSRSCPSFQTDQIKTVRSEAFQSRFRAFDVFQSSCGFIDERRLLPQRCISIVHRLQSHWWVGEYIRRTSGKKRLKGKVGGEINDHASASCLCSWISLFSSFVTSLNSSCLSTAAIRLTATPSERDGFRERWP